MEGRAEPTGSNRVTSSVRLRRRILARLRPVGSLPESIVTLIALGALLCAPAVLTRDIYTMRDRLLLSGVLVIGLAVRIGIATEWAEANESGIAWRTVFFRTTYRWDQVTTVEYRPTTIAMSRQGHALSVTTTLTTDTGQWTMQPSIGAGRRASTEFAAAAMRLRADALGIESAQSTA